MSPEGRTDENVRNGVRVGTLVWGAVLIVIGVLLAVAKFTTIQLDARVVVIGVLLLAGLALLVGGVSSAAIRAKKRRDEATDTLEQ
ncbi:hypothetical protein [Psychromicrobium lacuslunae]|uniref:hypothetical protein n=1 Tax=Psychromicrobium lacuslunae TaxID=1618207 RepID=UPI0005D31F2D|nr:hypothetical protein [Psychromicrobium lacuslunae]